MSLMSLTLAVFNASDANSKRSVSISDCPQMNESVWVMLKFCEVAGASKRNTICKHCTLQLVNFNHLSPIPLSFPSTFPLFNMVFHHFDPKGTDMSMQEERCSTTTGEACEAWKWCARLLGCSYWGPSLCPSQPRNGLCEPQKMCPHIQVAWTCVKTPSLRPCICADEAHKHGTLATAGMSPLSHFLLSLFLLSLFLRYVNAVQTWGGVWRSALTNRVQWCVVYSFLTSIFNFHPQITLPQLSILLQHQPFQASRLSWKVC